MIFNLSELTGQYEDVVHQFKELNIDKMINFVGSEGRYQWTIIILASVMSIMMSTVLYSTSFLLADPDFKCFAPDGLTLETCKETEFCAKYWDPPTYTKEQIDWNYNSWTKEY
jgi:MFS family permease